MTQKLKELKRVGYWCSDQPPSCDYIHPRMLAGKSNYGPRKSAVVQYLHDGAIFRRWRGLADSRLFPLITSAELGSRDLTDGEWVWPEGLSVYVSKADIELPQDFLASMEKNDYMVPSVDGEELFMQRVPVTDEFWISWCAKMLKCQGSAPE
jgi:hypothetical protein